THSHAARSAAKQAAGSTALSRPCPGCLVPWRGKQGQRALPARARPFPATWMLWFRPCPLLASLVGVPDESECLLKSTYLWIAHKGLDLVQPGQLQRLLRFGIGHEPLPHIAAAKILCTEQCHTDVQPQGIG